MKSFYFFALTALLFGGVDHTKAQVTETPATLGLVQGGNPQGYVRGSTAQGIVFSTAPGASGQLVEYSKIRGEGLEKAIRFEERVEVLGAPRALFAAEKYEEAAKAFGQVARGYAIIISAPENFALEAFFYEAESLRRAGDYEGLATIMELPVAASIENLLGEKYQRTFQFLKLWGLFGAKKMDDLESVLATFQQPVTGDAKLLGSANFNNLPGSEIAQLAYLRAQVSASKGDKSGALDDYYRTFTLAYGNDPSLSKSAMISAMEIHAEDPAIEKEGSPVQGQVRALAYLFSKRFDASEIPAGLEKFAVRPVTKPTPPAAPPAEGGEEKPDAEGDDAAPAPPADGEKMKEAPKAEKGGKGKG